MAAVMYVLLGLIALGLILDGWCIEQKEKRRREHGHETDRES